MFCGAIYNFLGFTSFYIVIDYYRVNMANFDAARIVLGNRKSSFLLAYKGYLFARNRTRPTKMYRRCVEKPCGVFLHTNVFAVSVDTNVVIRQEAGNHRHPPCDSSIVRRDLVHRMINVVQADPCAPVRSAYNSVTASQPLLSADSIPSFSLLDSKLLRRRAECFLPILHQLSDLVIAGELACTWDDRQHLSCLDNNWGMAVFLTDDNVRTLCRCDQIFIGGTFRTAPHPYRQLVTIHGFFRDTVVPLSFCLLSGKTVGQY